MNGGKVCVSHRPCGVGSVLGAGAGAGAGGAKAGFASKHALHLAIFPPVALFRWASLMYSAPECSHESCRYKAF